VYDNVIALMLLKNVVFGDATINIASVVVALRYSVMSSAFVHVLADANIKEYGAVGLQSIDFVKSIKHELCQHIFISFN